MNQPQKRSPSPWPYAIAGYFVVFISFLIVFITWAVKQNMDLVRPDYYAEEILYQRRIDTVNRTRPFAKEIAVAYDAASKSIQLRVPAQHARADFAGKVHLYRPSDAQLDRNLTLQPNQDGTQAIDGRMLRPGLWKVRLEWKAGGEDFSFDQSVLIEG
jgi:nitrogen fixation protein FixH